MSVELLICTIADMLAGLAHVAVGASSPVPGSAALLAQAREPTTQVSVLGSESDNPFTDGGVELFDCAAQGRIDAFFLSGGQIDGAGNVNLVGTGEPPGTKARFPGSFGSAYLYALVPRVILFREEHGLRTMVERVDFVSAPGTSPPGTYRPGGPRALVTGRCVFGFADGRFHLRSLHPGETLPGVRAATGFAFDAPTPVPTTPEPDAATLALLRGPVAARVARTYPAFCERVWPEREVA